MSDRDIFLHDLEARKFDVFDSIYTVFGEDEEFTKEAFFSKVYEHIKSHVIIRHNGTPYSDFDLTYHRKFGWSLSVSELSSYLGKFSFQGASKIEIGNQSYFSGKVTITGTGTLSIGSYTSIADGVQFNTSNVGHLTNFASTFNFSSQARLALENKTISLPNYALEKQKNDLSGRVTKIGHDVWIGNGVTVFNGVTIGSGSVIGAGAIVTKDVERYGVYVGSPAKLIRYRFEKSIQDQLIDLQWWNWDLEKISRNKTLFDTDFSTFKGNLGDLIV